MNILFLSYWEAEDGLSKATVRPHLKILNDSAMIRKIVYCSIERSGRNNARLELSRKIIHIPLFTGKRYYHKVFDFLAFPKKLRTLVKEHDIDVLICRGAPAGSLGYLVNKYGGTPYIVESFEPHSQYMAEVGVWKRQGLRYRFQKRWETAQLRTANGIITVSDSYRNFLTRSGAVKGRVFSVPCAVDPVQFSFNDSKRTEIRNQLGFDMSCVVGIYTGKFGGLYYDDEAFEIFSMAFRCIKGFRLIVLTPDDKAVISYKLQKVGVPKGKYFLGHVTHGLVSDYLSAADFAFALYKPSQSARFLSPVKVGEYWANGLPVMLTKDTGDDSHIIEREGGGVTFVFNESDSVFKGLQFLDKLVLKTTRPESFKTISKLALKYRSFDRVREVYSYFFTEPI